MFQVLVACSRCAEESEVLVEELDDVEREVCSCGYAYVAAVLSAGLALLAGKAISELVDRARPFVADPHGVHLFSGHAADAGFPSDHATAAFAIAVAILLRKRGWGIAALVAAAVLSV